MESTTGRERTAKPYVAVGLHGVQHAGNSLLALGVYATSELPDNAQLLVRSEPSGGSADALSANGARDAVGASARAIRVKILVHLIDYFVLRVGQGNQVGVGGVPSPGARVRVAFN